MSRGALAAMAMLAAMSSPVPALPVRHYGPGPFMRPRSQQKRRRLARRGGGR
jgi:hypothetical protein